MEIFTGNPQSQTRIPAACSGLNNWESLSCGIIHVSFSNYEHKPEERIKLKALDVYASNLLEISVVLLVYTYFLFLQKEWMSQIETAISNYATQHESKKSTAFCFPVESSEI